MTTDMQQETTGETSSPGGALAPRRNGATNTTARHSELVGDQGRTSIADSVVGKIAGLACREVSGVYNMGTGASRMFGAIKEKLPLGSSDPSPTQGVSVEVGERQAAIDLDIVVDYGAAIVDVAEAIRRNVIGKIEAMTGLEVTEVNVTVDDVYLGDAESSEPRVQ
ncbi:MAG TPA: Asp23/Gls24 family envelope stress response protein [Acidimicrobiia bacterium]|jgi:uncharacterized alkaline shock family protein YloU